MTRPIDIACPTCKAEPGSGCTANDPFTMAVMPMPIRLDYHHAARVDAAMSRRCDACGCLEGDLHRRGCPAYVREIDVNELTHLPPSARLESPGYEPMIELRTTYDSPELAESIRQGEIAKNHWAHVAVLKAALSEALDGWEPSAGPLGQLRIDELRRLVKS